MARRSLKPQLNQIRAWVRQGRTDAWIAHQLEVSASELREFRSQHDLTADEEDTGTNEIDLRDEIEAEIEAAAAEEPEEEEAEDEDFDGDDSADEDEGEDRDEDAPRESARREGRPRRRSGAGRERQDRERSGNGGGGDGQPRRRRRRGRRGGRGRRRPEYQATFDHGERDGYGLWLDPSVRENPVYSQHWAGKREVTVRIDPDQIVIRRPGAEQPDK